MRFPSYLIALAVSISLSHGVVVFDSGSSEMVDGTINDGIEIYNGLGGDPTTVIFTSGASITGQVGPDSVLVSNSSRAIFNGGSYVADVFGEQDAIIETIAGNFGNDFGGEGSTQITFSGGTVNDDFEIYDDATATISGGTINDNLVLFDNASVNVTGGTLNDFQMFGFNTTATISGGTIIEDIQVDGTLNVTGGIFQMIGTEFGFATQGGLINVDGSEWAIDGIPVSNGLITPLNGTLTGRLADGSAFNVPFDRDPNLLGNPAFFGNINLIPEPSSAAFSLLGALGLFRRRRA